MGPSPIPLSTPSGTIRTLPNRHRVSETRDAKNKRGNECDSVTHILVSASQITGPDRHQSYHAAPPWGQQEIITAELEVSAAESDVPATESDIPAAESGVPPVESDVLAAESEPAAFTPQ
ncbi:hypothetical protein CALCODRAFT_513494 [Calocera cornea HHB12733]|uniref:Uncharacterized protein n=1 Tax=Calocera cornea HHB12733 TaxID=1353952 RepID=A0A165C1L0_9BASI|nr:hypothetical protein CALCODRAFT_513494 [Calocera cornea HHB12733]